MQKPAVFFAALFVVSGAFAQVKSGVMGGGNYAGVPGLSASVSGISTFGELEEQGIDLSGL